MGMAVGRVRSFAPLDTGRFKVATNEAGSHLAPTRAETIVHRARLHPG
jgi:hypothetical protein